MNTFDRSIGSAFCLYGTPIWHCNNNQRISLTVLAVDAAEAKVTQAAELLLSADAETVLIAVVFRARRR